MALLSSSRDSGGVSLGCWSVPVALITLILLTDFLCVMDNGVEAKGMARGTASRNGGSGRTYLKKFGQRSVVYQRKIFNTKYTTATEYGGIGTRQTDKFKRKLSDGGYYFKPKMEIKPAKVHESKS